MSLSFKSKKQSGFSLVEVLVSTAIVVAILTFIILSQSTYSSDSSLANQADSVGLSISEAQVHGVSVQVTPGGNDFSSAYGVVFNIIPDSGGNDAYLTFVDKNNNGIYENSWACGTGPISECLSKAYLQSGYRISDLCVIPITGSESCGLGRIDVSFLRPNTDARIHYFNTSGSEVNYANTKGAKIKLTSPLNKTLSVVVYNTGQVSIQ